MGRDADKQTKARAKEMDCYYIGPFLFNKDGWWCEMCGVRWAAQRRKTLTRTRSIKAKEEDAVCVPSLATLTASYAPLYPHRSPTPAP